MAAVQHCGKHMEKLPHLLLFMNSLHKQRQMWGASPGDNTIQRSTIPPHSGFLVGGMFQEEILHITIYSKKH